jgi:UDP-glucose 4-epimerase
MNKRRILITGCAGFIGSNLADRLCRKGYAVVGVDNLAYGLASQIPPGVDFHKLDIRDPALFTLFQNVDTVFHLAAKNCISDCQNDPVETASINVTGTVNIFQAAQKAGVRKVVYAESSAIYEGSTLLPTPETEEAPQSFYALSKQAAHLFALGYARFHAIKLTGLRYFCVYGPRQDYRRTIPPVMSAFIIKLLRGEAPTIYGSGDKRRDFIHVDDINDFHELCIESDATSGQVFNLGSGTNYSVKEIYEHVSALLDIRLPASFRADMPGEAQETLADISRARRVGWSPKMDLDDGLRTMIEFIQKNALTA